MAILVKNKYVLLSKLGSEFNLSFSSHLLVGDKLIALDGIKKNLLVSEANNEWSRPIIIELEKLTAIVVKKSYGSIGPGELKHKGFEEFLKRIDLQFEYSDTKETVVLPFYDRERDHLRELAGLERNAKNWQMILSRMIGMHQNKMVKESIPLSFVE